MITLENDEIADELTEAACAAQSVVERPAATPSPLPLAPIASARARSLWREIKANFLPYVVQQAQYLGRAGVVGIGLLALSIGFFAVSSAQLRHQVADLRQSLQSKAYERTEARGPSANAPDEQLRGFVRKLPGRAELPALTAQVIAQAGAAGLTLERGNYDSVVTHSGRIVRARLAFPVNGAYPNIRRFIDGTLAAIPDAAVDGLRLERKNVAAGDVAAEVRFAIFLRNEP